MTRLRKSLSAVFLAVAMAMPVVLVPMMGTQTAYAGDLMTGGTYKASEWPSGVTDVKFKGNTTIIMDDDLKLTNINANGYELTIKGNGILTLEGSGMLIIARSLNIDGATVKAKQKNDAYNNDVFRLKEFRCTNAKFTLDDLGLSVGVYVEGDATISNSTIKTRTYYMGLDVLGKLTITSSELDLYRKNSGTSVIWAKDLALSDDIYLKSPAKGKIVYVEALKFYYVADENGKDSQTAVISKRRMSDSLCTVSDVYPQAYTGKAIKPDITVKWDGKTLKSGTDYTLSYKDNVNLGTATITITGKGNYTGTKTIKFKIKTKESLLIDFDDVKEGHTFYNPIYWAAYNEITYGVAGTNKFMPYGIVTRGQVVAFLYRIDGKPKTAGYKNLFKDVTSKSTFYNPILWGGKSKVVAGYSDGTFREKVTCTRGQIVAFLWRMAGKPEPITKMSPFKDVNTKNTFYKAILWAAEKGITVGYNDGTFRSGGNCTRGQMVAFLQRFAKQYPSKVKI